MAMLNLPGSSAYDSDADEILEQYDAYIVALVQKKIPRNCVRDEVLHDEIDELAQNVRIKLWQALRKKRINNPKAYIRSIVYTEVIDIVRQRPLTLPLPLTEEGELYQGNLVVTPSQGMLDPAYEVEQEGAIKELLKKTAEAVLKLPPQQQRAMICSLKDQVDDILLCLDVLRNYVDIEVPNWPAKGNELRSLRTSLSIARKKLRTTK
jgi:DNA-directed RNA polymerase specialized sigma24 family protein